MYELRVAEALLDTHWPLANGECRMQMEIEGAHLGKCDRLLSVKLLQSFELLWSLVWCWKRHRHARLGTIPR